ncbi:unnamed protein product [Alopecurus aequalis]
MQYNGPTFRLSPTVPEWQYPAGVRVENRLRVWASSRWRSSKDLATFFLRACYGHLPRGSRVMFRIEEICGNGVIGLVANFTNPFDAYHLIGHGIYCACEFIAFTGYNTFTNFDRIFLAANAMHSLRNLVLEKEEEQSR